jgi:signal transduction histidine kinase
MAALPSNTPGGFHPLTAQHLQGRFNLEQLWLRLTLHNDLPTTQQTRLVLQVPWLQHVVFYAVRTHKAETTVSTTWAGIADRRDLQHSNQRVPQVAITVAPNETVQVLVHVNSHASKLDAALYTDDQWQELERNHALLSGVLIGAMLVFAVYSAALWRISHAPAIAWQTIGFSLVTLYEASYRGYARVILWPDSTEWGYRAPNVFAAGIVLCLLLYLHARLRKTSNHLPVLGLWLLRTIAGMEIIVLLGALFGPYQWFAPLGVVMVPVSMLTMLTCTYIYHRQDGPSGRVALLIISVICICALLRMAAILLPEPSFVRVLEQYAVILPGVLVGLFVVTSWSYQHSLQRDKAQRALLQWQDQQQQRLEHEVQLKTNALNDALRQSEQRAQEQKELLAYVSHDLRAPTSAIIGHLRLMHMTGKNKLAAIEQSASYQLALIDELVEYAKEDLMSPLSLTEFSISLSSLLDELSQFAQALASRQGNTFTLHVQDAIPESVYLDGKRLQQALLNLLSNAAKFTHNGHISLRLWSDRIDIDNWILHFEVTDSGAGIDPKDLSEITQTLASNTPFIKGGLGLLIAQRIIQKMRSHLIIESHFGIGTRAEFSLSVKQDFSNPKIDTISYSFSETRSETLLFTNSNLSLTKLQKQELESMANQGNWSDLNFWINSLNDSEYYQPLIQEIRMALDQLDFEKISKIAQTLPTRE